MDEEGDVDGGLSRRRKVSLLAPTAVSANYTLQIPVVVFLYVYFILDKSETIKKYI